MSKGQIEEIINEIKNNSITSVDLSCMEISLEELQAISKALKSNNTVKELNVENNNIGYKGAKALAKILKGNNTVQILNVGDCNIGDEGAKILAKTLMGKPLEVIIFSYNKLTDLGAKVIAEILKDTPSLKAIDLSGNQIGDQGASWLANAVKGNNSLISIDLSGNQIGDEGASWLANAIKNTFVQEFNILDNPITNKGAKAFLDIFKTNITLTNFLFSDMISGEIIKQINEYLERNNNNNNKLIKESIFFIDEKFSSDAQPYKFNISDIHKFKLCQKYDPTVLKTMLVQSFNKSEDKAKYMVHNTDKSIKDNFFALTGVCQDWSKEMLSLPNEVWSIIIDLLGPQSLWTVKFLPTNDNGEITSIGEGTDFTSEQ